MLAASWGAAWSGDTLDVLLAANPVGPTGKGKVAPDLAAWLRDGFFEQHVRLFHNRPFVWQITDGRPDGFAALVNYHCLDGARLSKLTYTYLGEWIDRQRADAEREVASARLRLEAALDLRRRLQLIADGEPPHDVYVRWKPLDRQPLGWEPDLNDGVRLNIRPFVTAGVFPKRVKINVKWDKPDRGANPAGSNVHRWSEAAQRAAGVSAAEADGSLRRNDLHLTRAAREAARKAAESNGGS